MSSLDKEDLERIISSNSFDELIGKYENEWVDCKSQPYILSEIKNKRELAKDVSSFANSDGGYILIGMKTSPDDTHIGDKIDELKPFESMLIDGDQILKICEEWIYPKPEGLDVSWIPSKEDVNKGIGVIKIPSQSDSLKPFLIKNVLDGEKQVEIMFGYVERRRDKSQPYTLRDIQTTLRYGLNYERIVKGRFDALELMVNGVSKESLRENFREKLEERIKTTLVKTPINDERNLILVGFVESNSRIKNFSAADGIKSSLVNFTTPLRNGGWSLLFPYAKLETDLPDLIETEGGYAQRLSLYPNGTAIYACEINRISIETSSRIIPIALVEVIYQFVDLYKQILNRIEESFERFFIWIELNNLKKDNIQTKLSMSYHDYFPIDAPETSMIREVEESKNFDSSILAYRILKEIYEWFGYSNEPPFTKIENGVGKIDIELIRNS